jgi:hypothetical protein
MARGRPDSISPFPPITEEEENSMFIRKIAHASALAGMGVVSLWASAASSQPRAPIEGKATYAPIETIRYDFGLKSMSGYFVDRLRDASSC